MKESLLAFLVSPDRKEPLQLKNAQYDGGDIVEGLLYTSSGQEFPIIRGIPRFVSNEHYASSFGVQWNKFKKTQLDSVNGTTQSRGTFIEKTGWHIEDLAGSIILEAGCGMGRFLDVASENAKQVIGVDLSLAVEAAYENLKGRANVHIIQSDIFHLPFREGTFDRIFSIGALHHTPQPAKAFLALVSLLVRGGEISLWVYSKKIRNPIALFMSDFYRLLTTRLPHGVLLKLARYAIPLGKLYNIPVLGTIFNTLLPISTHSDPEWRWLDTFDWYSPRYQFKYSYDEIRVWFDEAGLREIIPLPVPVSMTAKKPL